MVIVKGNFGTDTEGPGFRELLGHELNAQKERAARSAEVEAEREQMGTLLSYGQRIPLAKGGYLDLDEFPYQAEPFYSDEVALEEEVVYMKATQIGATEAMWRWILWLVDQFGDTGIYYFPTDTHVTQFGDDRVTPVMNASDYLQRRLSGVNTKHLKKIGAGSLYFRGVTSLTAVQSVDADALIFDEYDESDPDNMEQAERRLSGSRAAGRTPRIRRFGRPTLPGYGIAAAFEETDQRKWMVTCPECGTVQEMTFEDNVRWTSEAGGADELRRGADQYDQKKDVTNVWRACKRCDASLEAPPGERGPIHEGTWTRTAKGPGRIPGYHVTRLIVPRTDLKAIVQASRKTAPSAIEVFHWADLGIPYAAADSSLDDLAIDRACAGGYPEAVPGYRGRFPTILGADVASERALNVGVDEIGPDGRRRALWAGLVEDDKGKRGKTAFEKLAQMMVDYQVQMAVVDAQPDRRLSRGFAAQFPGRVFICEYGDDQEDAIQVDTDKRKVRVDRTQAIDAMMDGIRGMDKLPLQRPPASYKEQLKSPKRRVVLKPNKQPRRVYVKTGSSGDDYAHMEVYCLVADELRKMVGVAQEMEEHQEMPLDPEEDLHVPSRGLFEYTPGFGG